LLVLPCRPSLSLARSLHLPSIPSIIHVRPVIQEGGALYVGHEGVWHSERAKEREGEGRWWCVFACAESERVSVGRNPRCSTSDSAQRRSNLTLFFFPTPDVRG